MDNNFVNKMKKGNVNYDINDARIGPFSSEDEGKVLVIDENGNAVPGEGGGNSPTLYHIESAWDIPQDILNSMNAGDVLNEDPGGKFNEKVTWIVAFIDDSTRRIYTLDNDVLIYIQYLLNDDTWELDTDFHDNGEWRISIGGGSGSGLYMHFVYLGNDSYDYMTDQAWTVVIIDNDPRDITDLDRFFDAISAGADLPNDNVSLQNGGQLRHTGSCIKATIGWNYSGCATMGLVGNAGGSGGAFIGVQLPYGGICYAVIGGYDENQVTITTTWNANPGEPNVGQWTFNGNHQANDCLEEMREHYGALTIPYDSLKNYPIDD